MTYTLMPGKTHQVGTEAETLSMIRHVLVEDEASAEQQAAEAKRQAKKARQRQFAPLSDDAAASEAPTRRAPKLGPVLKGATSRIQRKHLMLVGFALFAIWKPVWVVVAAVLLIFAVLCIFMIAGGEKIWKGVILGLKQVEEKDPVRGRRLRAKLDRFALRWDAFLDRFPDGMVDGLYLPDLQALGEEDAEQEERIAERLKRLQEQV